MGRLIVFKNIWVDFYDSQYRCMGVVLYLARNATLGERNGEFQVGTEHAGKKDTMKGTLYCIENQNE